MPASKGGPKVSPLFIAFVLVAVGSVALLIWLQRPGQSGTAFGDLMHGGDRAVVELVLERYKALAKNVTARVEAAEHALQELRKRQSIPQGRQQDKVEAAAEAATDAAPKAAADTDANAAPFDAGASDAAEEEEPEETDEERAARQEAEEKAQRALIQYDETTKTFRRYRGDYKCADRVPALPDGEVVECVPGFDAPCCSALGWCGRSAAHCKCDMCVDYRSKVKILFKSFQLDQEKRECQTITENLGEFKSPEECARKAVDEPECGRKIMYSFSYPDWGCRCCALDTPAGDEEKPPWNVYSFEVTEELI
eukprot:gb/GFBE01045394.1/.p1 GENE.gb/GFBE01045394.1/~~gb/GFBE01045394.1/.p1  ORF type:complete len:310 (+),score=61.81 gb/GFBE01045394.1/:1-930(+)